MGRIEDALSKLRAQNRLPASAAPAARVAEPRLATVVAREHDYGGKRVVVDRAQLRAHGLLAPDTEERKLAEQYRVIKRPLLRSADLKQDAPVPRGNLIMIGSALSGEGKTFTCVNLSLSMAREKDWSVVLVDADCSKPHLTRLFSAENEPGLIDLLRDPKLTFESVVMPTDVPGLSLLPAGTRDEHASELLASNRMDELCHKLSSESTGRVVLFDSSPLLLATEAEALALHVGQIVIVVRANETPQHVVLTALEKLDENKAISCILNQCYGGDAVFGYGDYQGYGRYGAYGGSDS